MQPAHIRKFEPLARGWRSFAWEYGVFDTAARPYTRQVEGLIHTPHHLILVTLDGGADHQEVTAACGHSFEGRDRAGAVSFVPAGCERRLKMRGVRSRWASLSLSPALFGAGQADIGTFTNAEDPFLSGLVAEFARLQHAEGRLDPAWCESMSLAAAQYLLRRYAGAPPPAGGTGSWKLPAWRLRRICDHLDAHIEEAIRISDLAGLVGLSPGHLHRAFRATTGRTPLAFINERRVQRAMQLLAKDSAPVAEVAYRVGFQNPSHFTRIFRRITGMNPSAYREGNPPPRKRRG